MNRRVVGLVRHCKTGYRHYTTKSWKKGPGFNQRTQKGAIYRRGIKKGELVRRWKDGHCLYTKVHGWVNDKAWDSIMLNLKSYLKSQGGRGEFHVYCKMETPRVKKALQTRQGKGKANIDHYGHFFQIDEPIIEFRNLRKDVLEHCIKIIKMRFALPIDITSESKCLADIEQEQLSNPRRFTVYPTESEDQL